MKKNRIFSANTQARMIAGVLLALGSLLGTREMKADPVIEKEFYSYSAQQLSGESLPFNTFRGKVVLLNFWANWCKPCFNEFPEIEKIHLSYKERGLEVVGLSITDNRRGIDAFIKKTGVTFDILIDQNESVSDSYKVSDMPTTILIGPDGEPLLRVTGFSKEGIAKIVKKLEKLLPGQAPEK